MRKRIIDPPKEPDPLELENSKVTLVEAVGSIIGICVFCAIVTILVTSFNP